MSRSPWHPVRIARAISRLVQRRGSACRYRGDRVKQGMLAQQRVGQQDAAHRRAGRPVDFVTARRTSRSSRCPPARGADHYDARSSPPCWRVDRLRPRGAPRSVHGLDVAIVNDPLHVLAGECAAVSGPAPDLTAVDKAYQGMSDLNQALSLVALRRMSRRSAVGYPVLVTTHGRRA